MRVGVLAVQMADRGVPVGGAGDQSGGRAHPGHVPVARERYLPLQVGHLPYQLDGCDPLRAGGHGRGARHQTPLVACRSIRYVSICAELQWERDFSYFGVCVKNKNMRAEGDFCVCSGCFRTADDQTTQELLAAQQFGERPLTRRHSSLLDYGLQP